MPTFLFGMIFYFSPESIGIDIISLKTRLILLSFIMVCTFVLPSLTIFYLYKAGMVESLELKTLPERRLPYYATALIYAFFSYFFAKKLQPLSEISPGIAWILGSITLTILLVALISQKWQISAHGTGVGGLIGALAGIMIKTGSPQLQLPLMAAILMAGWVISARLHLNAHTPPQAYSGLGLGLVVSISAVLYFF